MKATDAARIMGYLPDELVEGIVRSLGPRQAATLLTQLPPARAAALSRKLLYRTSSRETP
jgi:flagellar motility protein MotE (MotC chaperone)